jgi:hypothetical protein
LSRCPVRHRPSPAAFRKTEHVRDDRFDQRIDSKKTACLPFFDDAVKERDAFLPKRAAMIGDTRR